MDYEREGETPEEMSEEMELMLLERQRYIKALDIIQRLPRYVTGYLPNYRVEFKVDPSSDPIVCEIKVYWRLPREEETNK